MTRILVIDDNEDIAYAVKVSLEDVSDFKVVTANSGREGLELLHKDPPDLVLLDIMMPDMNGWIVNKEIKSSKKTRDIPVVFLTAKTDKVSRQMGSVGGEGFITKPFDPDALVREVKKILKNRS